LGCKREWRASELAAGSFDVFITVDQKLRYQQDVSRFSIAVVVLAARRNKIEFLVPLMAELRQLLANVQAGKVYRIGV
jgi:hypothetical protein